MLKSILKKEGFFIISYDIKKININISDEYFTDYTNFINKKGLIFSGKNIINKGGKFFILDPLDEFNLKNKKNIQLKEIGFGYIKVSLTKNNIKVLRDGMGLKSVYIYKNDGIKILSDDIQTIVDILENLNINLSFDRESLFNSLKYKTTLTNKTLFSNIEKLNFGIEYTISNGNIIKESNLDSIKFDSIENKDLEYFLSLYKKEFDKLIKLISNFSNYKSENKLALLFTGGVDSTILINSLKKYKANIVAITVVDPDEDIKDDKAAELLCKKLGIEHFILEYKKNDIEKLVGVVNDMGDLDNAMCGLSITIKKAILFLKSKNINYLISGSYIEPILGSNPQSLIYINKKVQKLEILNTEVNEETLPKSYFNLKYNYDFLENKLSFDEFLKDETNNDYFSEIFSGELNSLFIGDKINIFNDGIEFEIKPFLLNFLGINSVTGKNNLYNICTSFDLLYRGHFRNNYINERISINNGTNIFHPYMYRKLRDIIFNLPIKYKFNPNEINTTTTDNKFFLKLALLDYLPKSYIFNTKTRGSTPNYHNIFYSEINFKKVIKILKILKNRNYFSDTFMDRYLIFYYKNYQSFQNKEHVFYNESKILWKLVCLEIFISTFIEKIPEEKLKNILFYLESKVKCNF